MYNLRKFHIMVEYKHINKSYIYNPGIDIIKINGNSYNVEMNIAKLIYNYNYYDDDDIVDRYDVKYNVTKKIHYKKYNITVCCTFIDYTNSIYISVYDVNKGLTIKLQGISCNFCITEVGMSTINRNNLDIHKAIFLLKIFLNGIYKEHSYEKSIKGILSLIY